MTATSCFSSIVRLSQFFSGSFRGFVSIALCLRHFVWSLFSNLDFQGYIVQFNENELKDLLKLARTISNNINQIAVRANSGGGVYADDIAEIRKGVDQLWQPLRFFQSQLMSLQH